MELKVTILGCGPSGGVPLIGCQCTVCKSDHPYNYRLRSSIHLAYGKLSVLVDSGPDLRQQALREGIDNVDAVLYTHAHADHIHGIDELRSYNYLANRALPIYGDQQTLAELQERFAYVFGERSANGWIRPSLLPQVIEPYHPFRIGGLMIIPLLQEHGQVTSLGFRIGNFAYSTDVKELSEKSLECLQGIEVWVVDALSHRTTHAHASVEQTLEWIAKIKPKVAYLTHMSHDLDYESLKNALPDNVFPAYDGLQFTVAFEAEKVR